MRVTYYQVLGVTMDASEGEIKAAFRDLAMKYHPDRWKNGGVFAEEMFKNINEAFSVLSDPHKRKEYDEKLASGGETEEEVFSREQDFAAQEAEEEEEITLQPGEKDVAIDYKRNRNYFHPLPSRSLQKWLIGLGCFLDITYILLGIAMYKDLGNEALIFILVIVMVSIFFFVPAYFLSKRYKRALAARQNQQLYANDKEIDAQRDAIEDDALFHRAYPAQQISKNAGIGVSWYGGGEIFSWKLGELEELYRARQNESEGDDGTDLIPIFKNEEFYSVMTRAFVHAWEKESARQKKVDRILHKQYEWMDGLNWITMRGEDGYLRSNLGEIFVFTPLAKEMFVYRAEYCLTDPAVRETSEEFFYTDLISAETIKGSFGTLFLELRLSTGKYRYFPIAPHEKEVEELLKNIRKGIRESK